MATFIPRHTQVIARWDGRDWIGRVRADLGDMGIRVELHGCRIKTFPRGDVRHA